MFAIQLDNNYYSLTRCCSFDCSIRYSKAKGNEIDKIKTFHSLEEDQEQAQEHCQASGQDEQSEPLHILHYSASCEAADSTTKCPHCHCKPNISQPMTLCHKVL